MIKSNYIESLKNLHECCLKFMDGSKEQENFLALKKLFDDINLYENKQETKLFFLLIVQISNNHHRKCNFFEKIEQILILFKSSIKKYFSNSEIFNIFKKNKRILLFLIKEQIMQFDEYVAKKISIGKYKTKKYPEYFLNEIKPFMNEKWFQENFKEDELIKELPEDFNKLRNEGENESYICQLIRQDSVEEFVAYVNKNNYSLNSKIKQSIYETNSFLLKNKTPSLIEYSVFYGSIQIFRYLQFNKVDLTPSLWLYAIHGQNPEIIHILEDNHINPNEEKSFLQCLKMTIKTHSKDICSYIQNNYFNDIESVKDILIQCFKYYNFLLIQDYYIDQSSFHILCKYDYYSFVKKLIENVDVNQMKDNRTPLFYAVEKENFEIAQLLLSCPKIDINLGYNLETLIEKDKDNKYCYRTKTSKIEKTPLFQSIENENLEITKLLISNQNIDINLGYNMECKKNRVEYNEISIKTEIKTTLFIAIEKENLEIIRLLLSNENLESNIIYEENDNISKSALYLAIEKDNIKIVQLLLTHQTLDINLHNKLLKINTVNDIKEEKEKELEDIENDQDWSLLENEKRYYKCYEDGYDSKDQFDENNITALCLAIEKENIKIIQVLLSNENIDINKPNIISRDWRGGSDQIIEPYNIMKIEKTPLCLAVEKENIEIIKLLLSNEKLNINALNKTIKAKTKSDYYRGDQRYLRRYDENEKTTLYIAIENEKIEIVQLLLSNKKIDVNKNTYLLYSWQFGSLDYNSDLTQGSYEEKIKRENVKSPLYLAIEKENVEIVKLLLLNDEIDLNYLNKSIEFKIKRPVIYENDKDEDELIEQQEGISNEYQNIEINEAALHKAVFNRNVEIVKLLLSKEKIDVNILYTKNKDKQSYDDADNIDGRLRLPYQDFDVKIPDGNLKTEELEDASIIDLSELDEIQGEIIIDNSKEEKTALTISIEINEEIAKLLLSNKNINVCIPKIIETKTKTIENGEVNDDIDNINETPLHIAVLNHRINIVSILLKNKNIDINAKNNEGNTPIQCTDDEQIIQLFNQLSSK